MTRILVQIKSNASGVQQALRAVARRHIPFVTAVALTRVAGEARDLVRAHMPKHFKIRGPRVQRGVTIQRAEKRDWPRQFALVGTRDDFMALHVTGGVKRPELGAKGVAIPTRIVRRTGTGAVVPSQKPTRLRDKKEVSLIDLSGSGADRMIVENIKHDRKIRSVVKGVRSQRRDPVANLSKATWFFLKPLVRIRPRWPFEAEVRAAVKVRYAPAFNRELKKALESEAKALVNSSVRNGRQINAIVGKIYRGGN